MPKKTIYAEKYRELVNELRRTRKELGITQVELSKSLGWPQQRLSAVERGARRLDVLEYFLLAEGLGLTPKRALSMVLQLRRKQPDGAGNAA